MISRPRLAFCLFLVLEVTIATCAVVLAFVVGHPWIMLAFAVALSAFVGAMLLWIVRMGSYHDLVGYEPRSDYCYQFENTAAKRVKIRLDRQGFVWPDDIGHDEWDTGFVQMRLSATSLGKIFDPGIEVRSKHLFAEQCLERGVDGVRFVNISEVVSDGPLPGQRVWFRGRCVNWRDGEEATLILFHNEPVDGKLLVAAPHPDDAEIAAFGLYSRNDSFILTISGGEAGGFSWPKILSNRDFDPMVRAKVRVWDSVMVPSLGGVNPSDAVNLSYFDGSLADMFDDPQREVKPPASAVFDPQTFRQLNFSPFYSTRRPESTWDSLVDDLAQLLERVRPQVIVTPHPFIDSHPDHPFTTVAICQALRQIGMTTGGRMFFYTNHLPISELHPLGSSSATVSLPPNFGEGVAFDGIYSHPLSEEQRELKFLALEAMHDLRQMPKPEGTLFFSEVRSLLGQLYADTTGLGRNPHSYFRRAVRPNEIFFVVSFEKALELADQFVARWRAAQMPESRPGNGRAGGRREPREYSAVPDSSRRLDAVHAS